MEMEIKGIFNNALSRQTDEAVRVDARQGHELMSSRGEFNHPDSRIIVEKNPKPYFSKKVRPGL